MRSCEVDENIVRNREKYDGKDTNNKSYLRREKSEIKKNN